LCSATRSLLATLLSSPPGPSCGHPHERTD
jgi:hypothetical protein